MLNVKDCIALDACRVSTLTSISVAWECLGLLLLILHFMDASHHLLEGLPRTHTESSEMSDDHPLLIYSTVCVSISPFIADQTGQARHLETVYRMQICLQEEDSQRCTAYWISASGQLLGSNSELGHLTGPLRCSASLLPVTYNTG